MDRFGDGEPLVIPVRICLLFVRRDGIVDERLYIVVAEILTQVIAPGVPDDEKMPDVRVDVSHGRFMYIDCGW
jgi:hypothetical protein